MAATRAAPLPCRTRIGGKALGQVADWLADEMARVFARPQAPQKFVNSCAEVPLAGPDEFAAFVEADRA